MKPRMVFCDDTGHMFDHPKLLAAGADGPEPTALRQADLIRIPRGSDIMMLPGRSPVGFNPDTGERVVFHEWNGRPVNAVAAFMAPAFTQSHRAAYVTRPGAPSLPLFAYTALAYGRGSFYVAGTRVDRDRRQDPWRFDDKAIEKGVRAGLSALGDNRVAGQLQTCALTYRCRAAQNFFLGRWEAPLPVSVACNSSCVGCLSLQKDGEFKAAHDRLKTPPTAEEIAEVALFHIGRVKRAVVSFGQGCEGEPLISGDTIRDAIRIIRGSTAEGTINLNTNASRPDEVERLIDAGLDSMRVSLNSLREPVYTAYYRPKGYTFDDVLTSAGLARQKGAIVSLNLLYFPGVTDTRRECDAISAFFEGCDVNFIQMRNLNIDPEVYTQVLPADVLEEGFGVKSFMSELKEKFPHLGFAYFNRPKGLIA